MTHTADYEVKAEGLRMDAYYYGFDPTGIFIVDRILSAVATAGKAYHNTECWNDPWNDGEKPQVELIQEAAQAAAEEVRRLRKLLDEAQLRSIEARNPGIDMDEVRRLRNGSYEDI